MNYSAQILIINCEFLFLEIKWKIAKKGREKKKENYMKLYKDREMKLNSSP